MRDHFHVGDQVMFYHSGDPKHMASLSAGQVKEPGIAAVCVVSKVDPSASQRVAYASHTYAALHSGGFS